VSHGKYFGIFTAALERALRRLAGSREAENRSAAEEDPKAKSVDGAGAPS
jgi:hypothetical protein